jgi:hypothetical protein
LVVEQEPRNKLSWRDDGSLNGVDFPRNILPRPEGVPVRAIAEAMGCGCSHGPKVRSGLLVLHKRHWKTLIRLGSARKELT